MNDVIIDGNSLFARCWYAVKGDTVLTLKMCVTMVLQLLDQGIEGRLRVPISRTLFGWDGRAKTNKQRDPKPKEYLDTRYRFQEVLMPLFNTVHGYHADYEADDIVATAAFNSKARHIFVVSGDKDLMQLQGGNVSYYDLNTKAILPARTICRKFSVKRPSQIALAMAIIGDSTDNISGIPKWGPKKVARLFEKVTEDMSFSEALDVLKNEIPDNLLPCFLDCLDKTLLYTDIEGVPEPSPVLFCDVDELRSLKVYGIVNSYERVAMQYEDRKTVLSSMIKGSELE